MTNVITAVEDRRMFHLSVRALGGRFESEVEASVLPWPEGTVLLWRQGYSNGQLLSWLTSRFLWPREASETKQIVDLWAAEVGSLRA
jgi:hypothetical protein